MASRFIINNEITLTSENIDVGSITLEKATDLVGEELSADELHFRVFYDDSSSTLRNEPYAVPVVYYEGDVIVGTFYLTNVTRLASQKYQIDATSMVGILSMQMHYGGMFTATKLRSLLESIVLWDGLGAPTYNSRMALEWMTVSRGAALNNGTSPTVRSKVHAKFRMFGFVPGFTTGYALSFGNSSAYRIGFTKYYATPRYTLQFQVAGLSFATPETINLADLYDKDITLDIDPVGGSASCTIGDTSYTWDISSVQSTTAYINNQSATTLFNVGGDPSADGVYTRVMEYEVYNGGTKILQVNWSFYNPLYDAFYWHDWTSGAIGQAAGVIDWKYVASYSVDPVWVTIRQGQVNVLSNITYLDGADNFLVSGWLPVATKRELLYYLLFAMSLNMRSNSSGNLVIGGLSDVEVGNIPDSDIYMSGTEKPVEKTKTIAVTEHVYTQTTTSAVVFDNTTAAQPMTNAIVQFENAPVVSSSITPNGLTVTAQNCNAAIVTGNGTLTATLIDHARVVHEYVVSPDLDGRDVNVSSDTLITYLTVQNVMDRLKAFYNNTVTRIDNAIVYGGQQCGNKYLFNSPFGDAVSAFLSKISASVSTFAKLMCIFYKNYVPPVIGSTYSNYVLLTGSGTWTVPAGVTQFKAVLIGGGNGGDSGFAGEDGPKMTYMSTTTPAEGGSYGANGAGGKIYEVDVTSPAASYNYSCGTGGSGGAVCSSHNANNAGSAGGNTTFGLNSSASGYTYANGHQNLLNGLVYGGNLIPWNANSGSGGDGGWIEVDQDNNLTYHDGENAYNYRTGATYQGGATSQWVSWNGRLGGGGGGASASGDGESPLTVDYTNGGAGGKGADGANQTGNPLNIVPTYYGFGGIGGIGGGGGGFMGYPATGTSTVGKGGKGGKGMDGAPGCVIVYY